MLLLLVTVVKTIMVVRWTATIPSTEALVVVAPVLSCPIHVQVPVVAQSHSPVYGRRFRTCLKLQKGWLLPDNHEYENDNREGMAQDVATTGGSGSGSGAPPQQPQPHESYRYVTREMLQRDLLSDPQVKRKQKKKGGGYIPLDNRDHLPYVVKHVTPDPYTKPEMKRSKQGLSHRPSSSSSSSSNRKKRADLELIGSRLSVKNTNKKNSKDGSTILGEFPLDKSTTSGDIICIADRTYKVETARCQYKYAGGQRFVMVRKILEVKEITRSIQEAQLEKQLALSSVVAGTNESQVENVDQNPGLLES